MSEPDVMYEDETGYRIVSTTDPKTGWGNYHVEQLTRDDEWVRTESGTVPVKFALHAFLRTAVERGRAHRLVDNLMNSYLGALEYIWDTKSKLGMTDTEIMEDLRRQDYLSVLDDMGLDYQKFRQGE